ncbi:F-box family protein [Klebsormidium nitens]|uniref:F-box family protein n=1 Tax=Klebsormidium nitens TaxID=105231 RepID=A0A1Y1I2X2_KLENI|nr:F-box family protein [Klebsormidium nitens]|eukprot:GAQ85285.1 F-box family protein [Klebsormidium nitens]
MNVGQGKRAQPSARTEAAGSFSISCLGSDLLSKVFIKLGSSPKDLAAVSVICKDWRTITETITWRDLCFRSAGGLCEELGYGDHGLPPGGWRGLFKLITYCPGLHPSLTEELKQTLIQFRISNLGHVEWSPKGFWTGPSVMKVLQFKEHFQSDQVFVSVRCAHDAAGIFNAEVEFREYGCRGIIKDFASSRIRAALSEVNAFGGDAVGAGLPSRCPYCQGATAVLDAAKFFKVPTSYKSVLKYIDRQYNDFDELLGTWPCQVSSTDSSDDEEVDDWGDPIDYHSVKIVREEVEELEDAYTFGRVCEGGHLLLAFVSIEGVEEEWDGACAHGTGENLAIEAFPLIRMLYGHLVVKERSIKRGFKAVAGLVETDVFAAASRAAALAQSWSRTTEAQAVPMQRSVLQELDEMTKFASDGTRKV